MRLAILLSTYNGEKYLPELLDSLLKQTLVPSKIIIRDDGSSDGTLDILKKYKENNNIIEYYCGDNLGPAKSFFDLINRTDNYDYYALCDQDDVWFNDKLEAAVDMLEKHDGNNPLLYCSRYTLTDRELNPINSEVSSLYNFSDFPHSLIYHTAPGCTFVFNDRLREKIIEYDVNKNYCLIHDAIIHKVAAMFGEVILDHDSHIYYRQHGDNEIGMNANKVKVFFGRINRFLNGNIKHYRSNSARGLLKVYGDKCSKENRHLLEVVAEYMNNREFKKELMNSEKFKSHTVNDLFFKVLVLVNYI